MKDAIEAIEADRTRSADTHLRPLTIRAAGAVHIYLKDESTHPTGSLKHRLARSLFLFGLVNGWLREGRPAIDASSGSTAISEAYFARLIGIPFIAVVPARTAARKLAEIAFHGGQVDRVDDPRDLAARCHALAADTGGHFLDQFTYAERATEWRGNNNIAESLFDQMGREPNSIPAWVVVGAGTGGTAATIGRYMRYKPQLVAKTRLCVVDPEGSAYFPAYRDADWATIGTASPIVEGIGRPRVEASFVPSVVNRMIAVPDAASVAACLWLEKKLGRRVGPSTGTNLIGTLVLAGEMKRQGRAGSIVTLICDGGERYSDTIYDGAWRARSGLDLSDYGERLDGFDRTGLIEADLPTANASWSRVEHRIADYAI
ncbi:MAG: pyridoxal-phosphate dependent enzyme [Rhizomicrobium sp.]